MKIEIDLPESVITEAACRAWKESFRYPEYTSSSGGYGYEVIKKSVSEYLEQPETVQALIAEIRSTASTLAPAIVKDCVVEELRKLTKKIVKEERESSSLFKP